MKKFSPRIRKQQCLRRRIVAIDGGPRHFPFGEAHDLTLFQINGGKNNHGFHSRKRARSEEHTSELQSLMRISYAVFCLKKKKSNDANEEYKIKTHEYNT